MKKPLLAFVTMFILCIGSYVVFTTNTVSACGCGCGISCGGRCGCRCTGCEFFEGLALCVTCCDEARVATGDVEECPPANQP